MTTRSNNPAAGFSLITAIFLLVVLALLGAAMLNISGLQHTASALDVQSSRAYQAARAGMEWGVYQVMDPQNTVGGPTALPTCFASTSLTLGGTLTGFATTVTCTLASDTELNRNLAVYQIVSTASQGTAGNPDYVQRQLQAVVTRCKDPTAAAPRFPCP